MINQLYFYSIKDIRELEKQPCEITPEKRFQLWSVAEIMDRFHVPSFTAVISNLGGIVAVIFLQESHGFSLDYDKISAQFSDIKKELADVKLSRVLRTQIDNIERLIAQQSDGTTLKTSIRILQDSIVVELTSSWFLRIPEEKRLYFEQPTPAFGHEVNNVFPAAGIDISAASRCFALDEWTACVFHLMRVLELGLRTLNNRLGLPDPTHEEWRIIIDGIIQKVKELRQEPKTPQRDKDIQYYSEAMTSFSLFKDAWRNYVVHAHAHYDEREAVTIWNAVKSFMVSLAGSH